MRVERVAVEKTHCPFCGARPKQKCQTISGAVAPVHMPRWQKARSQFFIATSEGWRLKADLCGSPQP